MPLPKARWVRSLSRPRSSSSGRSYGGVPVRGPEHQDQRVVLEVHAAEGGGPRHPAQHHLERRRSPGRGPPRGSLRATRAARVAPLEMGVLGQITAALPSRLETVPPPPAPSSVCSIIVASSSLNVPAWRSCPTRCRSPCRRRCRSPPGTAPIHVDVHAHDQAVEIGEGHQRPEHRGRVERRLQRGGAGRCRGSRRSTATGMGLATVAMKSMRPASTARWTQPTARSSGSECCHGRLAGRVPREDGRRCRVCSGGSAVTRVCWLMSSNGSCCSVVVL